MAVAVRYDPKDPYPPFAQEILLHAIENQIRSFCKICHAIREEDSPSGWCLSKGACTLDRKVLDDSVLAKTIASSVVVVLQYSVDLMTCSTTSRVGLLCVSKNAEGKMDDGVAAFVVDLLLLFWEVSREPLVMSQS